MLRKSCGAWCTLLIPQGVRPPPAVLCPFGGRVRLLCYVGAAALSMVCCDNLSERAAFDVLPRLPRVPPSVVCVWRLRRSLDEGLISLNYRVNRRRCGCSGGGVVTG